MAVRRAGAVAVGLAVGGAGLAVILASPLILARVSGSLPEADVRRMSDIGQAYGGISAFLAGFAAAGVAAALLVQIRLYKVSQAQGIRMLHVGLMEMLIRDPSLRPVSPDFPEGSVEGRRQGVYTNLVFRYLETGYEIGYFSAESIRLEMEGQFRIPQIRKTWDAVRPKYYADIGRPTRRRFIELMEGAYRATAESDIAAEKPKPPPSASPRAAVWTRRSRPIAVVFIAGLGVGVGVGVGVGISWVRQVTIPMKAVHSSRDISRKRSASALSRR
jgi:hypothetical protein